jgi:hypothetical protein
MLTQPNGGAGAGWRAPGEHGGGSSNACHPQRANPVARHAAEHHGWHCFTVGIAAPIAAVFFYSAAPAGLRLVSIVLGIVFWLAAAVMLHLAGRMVLGGLRQP